MAGITAVGGVLVGGIRWIYRQGSASQELIDATRSNTRAMDRLTIAYEASTERIDAVLVDHERRLTRVEEGYAARARQETAQHNRRNASGGMGS